MGRESDIEKKCCLHVESYDLKAYKLRDEIRRGWPDRTIFLESGRVVFVEFKSPRTGRLRPDQAQRIEELERVGEVWIVDSVGTFQSRFDELMRFE